MALIGKLKALTVTRTKEAGRYGDGGGLYLQVTTPTARSWIFRYWIGDRDTAGEPLRDKSDKVLGRSCEMGLGSTSVVSLEEARDLAAEYRKMRRQGIDPLTAQQVTKAQATVKAAKAKSFAECADDYYKAHRAGWRHPQHAYQWQASIRMFADPVIGPLPVQAIDTALVLKVLQPIWNEKPETANRLRGRLENILDYAKVNGFRAGDNPARWRGHLDKLLPAPSKVRKLVHFKALPYPELPAFMATLRTHESIAAKALQFTILTSARTGEVLGARWSEMNLAENVWTVPPGRMKTQTQHRKPLTTGALAILEEMQSHHSGDDGLVFPGRNHGRLMAASMLRILARMQRSGLTVHGFRSSFRDWAAERTGYPSPVVELQLAHQVGDKVQQAYLRGDALDKRRRLMADWARFCNTPAAAGTVIPLRAVE